MSISKLIDSLEFRWLLRGTLATALVAFTIPVSAPRAQEEKPGEKPPVEAKPEEAAAEEPEAVPEGPVDYLTLPLAEKLRDDYKSADKSEEKKARDMRGELRRLIDQILKDEKSVLIKEGQNAEKFDGYFTRYVFAQMTLPDRSAEFAKDRQAFFNKQLLQARGAEVHERLVNLTFRTMLDVAKQNYHPAARYNAMLIIGDLNDKEAVKGGANPTAPEPSIQALAAMLKELESPTQIDAVRVACLIGILRHAEMDGQKQDLGDRWEPRVKTKVIDQMLAVLNTKELPAGRSAEGHVWLQRRAIDVLGAIGDHGADGMVAKRLEAMIGEEGAPLALRCNAAVALGRINSLASSKINAAEASLKLNELAVQATKYELARLDAEKKHRSEYLRPFEEEARGEKAGGGFGPGIGGPGIGGAGRPPGVGPGAGGRPPGVGPGAGGAGRPPGAGAGGVGPGPGPGKPPGVGSGPGGAGRPPGVGPGAGGPGKPPGVGPPGSAGPGAARGFQGAGPKLPGGLGGGGTGPKLPGAGLGPGGGMGPGGPGGLGGGAAEDPVKAAEEELEYRERYKLLVSCRRLKYELACVKLGLEGTPASRPTSGLKGQFARDPYKPYIEKLLASIDKLGKSLDKPDSKDSKTDWPQLNKLVAELEKGLADLEKLAAEAPAAKKPEAAAAEGPADGPDAPEGPPAKAADKPEEDGPDK